MNNNRLRPNITRLLSHGNYIIVAAGLAESQFTNLFKDKSFVDDLNRKRGIVSVRVVFVLRSTEIQPVSLDLFSPDVYQWWCDVRALSLELCSPGAWSSVP